MGPKESVMCRKYLWGTSEGDDGKPLANHFQLFLEHVTPANLFGNLTTTFFNNGWGVSKERNIILESIANRPVHNWNAANNSEDRHPE